MLLKKNIICVRFSSLWQNIRENWLNTKKVSFKVPAHCLGPAALSLWQHSPSGWEDLADEGNKEALGVEVGKRLLSQYFLLEHISNDKWASTNGPLEDTCDVNHNKIWALQSRAQGSWSILQLPFSNYFWLWFLGTLCYSLILAGFLSSSLILLNFGLLN